MESDQMLWDMLKSHIGHQVRIVAYGDTDDPMDICLECEECGEVILDAEIYTVAGAYSFFRYVPSGAFSLDFTVPRATHYGIL